MMKRMLGLTLSAVMLFSLLAGCGGGSAPPAAPPAASSPSTGAASSAQEPAAPVITEEFLSLGTSSSGGTFNTLGVSMCQMWNDEIAPTVFTAEVTAGSTENCLRIGMNEIQLAFATASAVYEAHHGVGTYEGKQVEGIKTIACLYPAILQFPVLQSANISVIDDIAGKKINLGESGSGTEATSVSVLGTLGITTADFNAQHMSHANAATALTDEKIDGYLQFGASGQSHQMTAMASGKCDMIGLSDTEVSTLIAKFPYYYAYTMPSGVYPHQDYDINTVATGTLLICNESLSDEVVYQIVKNLFENLDLLAQSQAIANEISLDSALNVAGVDLHPGAERYYREVGIL